MSDFFHQKPIILASGSSNRYQLLASTGLEFAVHSANIDEQKIKEMHPDDSPIQIAKQLAEQKALEVSKNYFQAYVIGCDQLCSCEDKRYDKPLTHERALNQLLQLQGKTHQQICAMSIAYQGRIIWSEQDIAVLTMKTLSTETLDAYLLRDKPYNSCGSYHFEQAGKWLFKSVDGSESSIQGLALVPLLQALCNFEIVTLP